MGWEYRIALIEVGEEERQGLENLNYDGAKGWEAFAVVPTGLHPGQYFASKASV